MTQIDYMAKRKQYMASNASPEVKAKAITELDAKFTTDASVKQAIVDMRESAPDIPNSVD